MPIYGYMLIGAPNLYNKHISLQRSCNYTYKWHMHQDVLTTIDYIYAAMTRVCVMHGYTIALLFTLSSSLSLPLSLPPSLPPPLPVFLSYIHTLTHSIVHLSEVALELLCQIVHTSFASVLGTVCSTEDFYLLTYASFGYCAIILLIMIMRKSQQ